MADGVDYKALAAERWFGYGRWSAPYWFVGKEPGGKDDAEQYASWWRRGGAELIDCRLHDLDCPNNKRRPGLWHGGERPPLQPTWRPLIATVLAFEGAEAYGREQVREYQDTRWGTTAGDTAVIELSAIAAPEVGVVEALRLMHVNERISTIRQRIADYKPTFVVFYGLGVDPVEGKPYLDRWNEIAGVKLTTNDPVKVGATVFVAQPHPTAHGTLTQHWHDLGKRLRVCAVPSE